MRHNQSRGFTLVELLVVISIIGLIASAVMYNLESARMRGRDAKRIRDVDTIVQALFLYQLKTGNEFGAGTGCGLFGEGAGWFTASGGATYQQSIAQCFVDLGLTEGLIQDPLQTRVSDADSGFSYMIGAPLNPVSLPLAGAVGSDCVRGKTRYVYAKLEGRPQSPTALDTTCEINWDSLAGSGNIGPGMNYFKKFE